jgi:hypothetical protein
MVFIALATRLGAMARTLYFVLLADVLMLVALLLVEQDLAWRTAYAASFHSACPQSCGYSPSFSYGILTQFFAMSGNHVVLTSPPTLDWVQVLAYALIVVNVWFAYQAYKAWKSRLRPGLVTATA